MAINRWDPFTVLARVDDDFEGLVRRTWGNAVARTAGYVPAIDMVNDGTDVIITLELPGLDIEKDVEIEVHEGRLTISGQRQDTVMTENSRTLVRELRYGSFRRDFALPDNVTAEDISADYDKGLLTVRVKHVTKPVEEPRKIEIKGGSVVKAVTKEESVQQAA